jgi:bifunctional NMN adenylyltransferase/nudix hydrolase
MDKFHLAVYIGRFQPFHRAHLETIEQGLKIADRILICIGSRNKARRTERNPWNSDERKNMIVRALQKSGAVMHRVHIVSLFDLPGDDEAWFEQVQERIDEVLEKHVHDPFDRDGPDPKVTLIGHVKDASSFYLQSFPRLVYSPATVSEELVNLNATDIRAAIREKNPSWENLVPDGTRQFLQDWLRTHDLP